MSRWLSVDTSLSLKVSCISTAYNVAVHRRSFPGDHVSGLRSCLRQLPSSPLVAWERHPFCISIARKLHKRQMKTGWTTANPDSLSQRDDTLNDILVETQASNYFKHDFDPSTYPRLQQMVQKISISSNFHNPDLDCELWEDEKVTQLAERGYRFCNIRRNYLRRCV